MKNILALCVTALVFLSLCALPVAAQEERSDYVPFQGEGFQIMVPAGWEMEELYGSATLLNILPGQSVMMGTYEKLWAAEALIESYIKDIEGDDDWRLLAVEQGENVWRFQVLATGDMYRDICEEFTLDTPDRGYAYVVFYLFETEDALVEFYFIESSGSITDLVNDSISTLRFSPAYTPQ